MSETMPEIHTLADQLEAKRGEYFHAIRCGVIFDQLKIIFFEIKELKQRIDSFKVLTLEDRRVPANGREE